MKESPLSRVVITAEEAGKIAAVAQKYNSQAKAEEVLGNTYKGIRAAASTGYLKATFDLLGDGGVKGLVQAEEIREIVIKALKEKGYMVRVENKWILRISWGPVLSWRGVYESRP